MPTCTKSWGRGTSPETNRQKNKVRREGIKKFRSMRSNSNVRIHRRSSERKNELGEGDSFSPLKKAFREKRKGELSFDLE